jgi:hypothetical protein
MPLAAGFATPSIENARTPLLQRPPFICDSVTTDLNVRHRQRATPRR